MQFDIITIFPHIFDSYFSESIIKRAAAKKLISINVHNLRDFTQDAHRTVDDTPYGGGAGMVMKVEPIHKCVEEIKSEISRQKPKIRTILFSAKGKRYSQKDARRLAKYDSLILICGRYEGVDERVAEYVADEEISVGDYILTGGELPAMILADSISRLISGVLGNPLSLNEESFKNQLMEYPQYTKPKKFLGWSVPEALISGNHKKIEEWRRKRAKQIHEK